MAIAQRAGHILDRLDQLSPWAFTGVLYLVRWVVVIPLTVLLPLLGITQTTDPEFLKFPPESLLFNFLVLAPILETIIECTIPYVIMRSVGGIPSTGRPWGFVAVSAAIMALLHTGYGPAPIVFALITGAFLAYVYAHFAPRGFVPALLHTAAFHAAINLVGWILLVLAA